LTTLCTLSELKRYVGISDTADDDNLLRVIAAASDWITEYCGRTFEKDAADTTRLFYPTSTTTLDVPDLVTVTSIKTDSSGDRSYATALATTDYELLPLDGPPYDQVRIWPRSSKSFEVGRLVQIVGKFGMDESSNPPPAVKQAALILSSRYYKRGEAPFGVLQSTDLGQFTRISKEDPDVISLLAPYRLTGASWVLV
jgi:hypothetical protein